jgi:hypothetical protein
VTGGATAPRPASRVWIVPTIFALVGLSMPVQMYVKEAVGEPYPGLFQPAFSTIPEHDGKKIKYRDVALKVDGRTIDDEVLFPGLRHGRRRQLLVSMFPPQGGSPAVDDETRVRFRSRLADHLGAEPRILTATWQRLRFNPDTRTSSVIRTQARYRIDLTGGDR